MILKRTFRATFKACKYIEQIFKKKTTKLTPCYSFHFQNIQNKNKEQPCKFKSTGSSFSLDRRQSGGAALGGLCCGRAHIPGGTCANGTAQAGEWGEEELDSQP